jgi:UPF0755 protein
MVKKIIAVLISAVFLFAIVFAGWYSLLDTGAVMVTINDGDNARAVARTLKGRKIISSEILFLAWVKLTKSASSLKPGVYKFTQKHLTPEIVKILREGAKDFIKVTIPEGADIKKIAEILFDKGVIANKEEFINLAETQKMEGYLMPETYIVSPRMSAQSMIKVMHDEFINKITPEMYERAEVIGMSMQSVIILASIVEREAVADAERPVIAAVFLNRLAKGQKLESCATVQYALGEQKARLLYKDLEIDSPYNTYKHKGLPPAPICNPGLACIKAVLWPAKTDSLFFVSRGDGTHEFSETLAQHNKNKQKLLPKQTASVK